MIGKLKNGLDTAIYIYCPDFSETVVNQYVTWAEENRMPCNVFKCKELVLRKRNSLNTHFNTVDGINQCDSLKLLGLTFQSNCRFSEHIKLKLKEANKGLFIIRSLRKEGYSQKEIDYLFSSIILPKITYGLSVYAASLPELRTIQNFLTRCFKRRYMSEPLNINVLLERSDIAIFNRIRNNCKHPLFDALPVVKKTSYRLRHKSSLLPRVNTERFKCSFMNRIVFKHNHLII